MAHNIFGQRFLGRRTAAWHELGTVFPADMHMSPPEAVLRVGGDFHVQKLPLICHLPDGTNIASDRVALVRYPTHDDGSYRILGYGGKDYELVTNMELAFMLEKLAEEWPLETIGILNEGRDIFMTLDAGGASVAGEEVHQYFLLSNSHTGGKSLKIALTPVRVVCQNTLVAGTSAASILSTLPHTVNVRAEVNFRIDLIANMRRQQVKLLESFEAMARYKVDEEQTSEVLAAAYPYPNKPKRAVLGDIIINDQEIARGLADDKKLALAALTGHKEVTLDWERECKRMDLHRAAARERYMTLCEEHKPVAQTAWAVYNGITETECYRDGGKDEGKVGQSILFGQRAATMGRAYNRCMAIMGADA